VGAELGALVGVETTLEQGAEDRGLDQRPVELADLQECGDLRADQRQDVAGLEQTAVEPVVSVPNSRRPCSSSRQLPRAVEEARPAVGGL
jgi:hypothetical protein